MGDLYTQICSIKNAHRRLMVGLLQGLEVAHEKKGRVIFDVLHTKLTLVGAQMAQIEGKWAKPVIF